MFARVNLQILCGTGSRLSGKLTTVHVPTTTPLGHLVEPISEYHACKSMTSSPMHIVLYTSQILDGETIREWMQPAYKYFDRTGFGHPWELVPLGDFTLRTKDGVLNGYNSEFQMAVRHCTILKNSAHTEQKQLGIHSRASRLVTVTYTIIQ